MAARCRGRVKNFSKVPRPDNIPHNIHDGTVKQSRFFLAPPLSSLPQGRGRRLPSPGWASSPRYSTGLADRLGPNNHRQASGDTLEVCYRLSMKLGSAPCSQLWDCTAGRRLPTANTATPCDTGPARVTITT
jgi:hypothetical protein